MCEMKCPFCQQELKDQWVGQNVAHEYFDCPKCKMNGNPKLWQELIRTRKALDVAVVALNKIKGKHDPRCAVYHIDEKTAYDALEQINNKED